MEVMGQADVDRIRSGRFDHFRHVGEYGHLVADRVRGQFPVQFADRDQIGLALADRSQVDLADLAEPAERDLHDGSPSSAATWPRASRAAAIGSPPSTCS